MQCNFAKDSVEALHPVGTSCILIGATDASVQAILQAIPQMGHMHIDVMGAGRTSC